MWNARALAPDERLPQLQLTDSLHLPGVLQASDCAAMVERIVAAEAEWSADFGGDQFSLGLAWYTHLETGRARHYFRDAAQANTRVERVLPGVQAGVRALLAELVGEAVVPREGWCGPGVHVFVPDSPVARGGGSVHYDLEGLRTDDERRALALSFVLMLQPAESGGGLRLWPGRHEGDAHPSDEQLRQAYRLHEYTVGDAVVFESQRLHQIEPFAGTRRRISITAHVLREPSGRWVAWF